jgi:hypothetical protein
MLLKLVLPAHPRILRGGWIGKWHVTEDEWVNYGDDLFDLTVDEGLSMRPASAAGLENYVRSLIRAQETVGSLTDEQVMAERDKAEDYYAKGRVNWFLRVSSSDMGRLRRLSARCGERREVGDVLAVFTTEADEPIEQTGQAIAQAAVFRTVVTPTPLWQEEA